ncbi:MAG TPA: hypothetical protein VG099_17025 [Gemmataceae bacterium]|jgi:hypothetical protein|nr:hypothetical protein [Gemmataceae bacterium]
MNPSKQSDGRRSLKDVLRRGLLGKAGVQSTSHYAGSDEYWNQAVAAQFDWRQRPQALQGDLPVVVSGGPPTAVGAIREPGDEASYEPIYGMTRRQLKEWLARNPGLKPVYENELRKLRHSSDLITTPAVRLHTEATAHSGVGQ